MGLKRTNEFRKDAVRVALTSGLTRKQVADDLGVGMSTLNKWITAHRDTDVVSNEDLGWPKRMTGSGARTAFSRRRGRS
jgi:transposase